MKTVIIRKLSVGNTAIMKKYFVMAQYFRREKSVLDLEVTGLISQFSDRDTHRYLQQRSYSNSGIHFPYCKTSLLARIYFCLAKTLPSRLWVSQNVFTSFLALYIGVQICIRHPLAESCRSRYVSISCKTSLSCCTHKEISVILNDATYAQI